MFLLTFILICIELSKITLNPIVIPCSMTITIRGSRERIRTCSIQSWSLQQQNNHACFEFISSVDKI
jgi:hypothetical protein